MFSVTYPDGSQFTTTALTDSIIETAFQQLSAQMLGWTAIPLTVQFAFTQGSNQATVTTNLFLYVGQLVVASALPTDTTIIAINGTTITLSNNATASGSQNGTVTDPLVWNKVRIGWQQEGEPGPDITFDTVTVRCTPVDTYFSRLRDQVRVPNDSTTLTQQDVFTRTWRTHWTFYGPNALIYSKTIQSSLIKSDFVSSALATNNLYVNPDIAEPLRNPELWQGRWWERVDMWAEFNEEITETLTVGTVASVEVKVYTKDGEVLDTTVSST